jgi:hypothetical protein
LVRRIERGFWHFIDILSVEIFSRNLWKLDGIKSLSEIFEFA